MTWSALGYRFGLSAEVLRSEPSAVALLEGLLEGPYYGTAEVADLSTELSCGGPEGLAQFIARVNAGAMAAAEGHLLLHAGAVAWGDGRVVVLCGPSGSGKTTLTGLLVDSGLAYVTDETVCVDPHSLRVTPFRKPLSIKGGSAALFPQLEEYAATAAGPDGPWLLPPSALAGAPMPTVSLRAALLIFPTFLVGTETRAERLSEARSAYLLGSNSSRLSRLRGGALEGLGRVARRVPAFSLVHAGGTSLTSVVRELLEAA